MIPTPSGYPAPGMADTRVDPPLFRLLLTDEAPDTGEESDEDLITSYLGGGGGGPASPATRLPAFPDVLPHHAPSGDPPHHILADNLLQLAEIHENIQRMRLANTEGPSRPPRSHRAPRPESLHQRWSTSCPALNHEAALDVVGGAVPAGSFDSGPSPESPSHPVPYYSTTTPTSSTSHTGRSHRKRWPGAWSSGSTTEGPKHRGKTRPGRPRSYSASSNDSDDPFGQPSGDYVDGCLGGGHGSQPRLRSASTVATTRGSLGNESNYGGPPSGPSSHRTPEKLLPRPPVGTRYTPNIFSQFPGLHKSISTPSIATDHPHSRSAHRKGRDYPEPTHVFLQKLISEHEWTRRSGSDSDSDDEPQGPPPSGLLPEIEGRRQHHRVPFPLEPSVPAAHPSVQPAPSPQISLAEFLQDVPNLEDDDQRKRRRKKERSSIFFRKKKDKSKSASASLQTQPDGHLKSLAKAPSAISLSTKPLQTRVPQHSYSMSSLRKPSSHNHYAGNFYHARGEMSKVNHEDRDDYGVQEDTTGLIEGEYVPGEEFSEGGPAAIRNLETDPFLRIQDEEAESWQQAWKSQDLQGLTPTQIKRQEHIYELIVTESNHCQVLKVIQKIFVEGMYKYLNIPPEIVDRIFPCIEELIEIHFKFLEQLRIRQNAQPVVESVADLLLEQFAGESSKLWKEAYGTFCSQHSDAVSLYKDIYKSDRRFQQFIRHCANNPLLKKKGIPECILFVTTRITKYPLLIEPLIKTARDLPQEQQKLRDANVNAKVAEKEREQRFLEIYKGIDAKSWVLYQGKKFKKSDILSESRKLMFEGLAVLHQGRGRSLSVTVVVLSDILFFLQENSQKYHFTTPEGKPGVIPVHTLIAREKTGPSTKALYLISTSERDPEMFELEIQQPPTRDDWITGIREAVDACSYGSDSEGGVSSNVLEARRNVEAKYMRMRHLTAELRGKDIELARLLEDKMRVMGDMLVVLGTPNPFKDSPPDYLSLVREKDSHCTKEDLLNAVQEASRLASSLYSSGSNLSRSVSSAGEKHSVTYASPTLPKRAETFGGFDQQQPTLPMGLIQQPPESLPAQSQESLRSSKPDEANPWRGLPSVPPLLNLEAEQQEAAVQITHYLNSLMCMVSEHFTSLESMKAEISEIRDRSSVMGGRYKHNQQLEELRNLQDRMVHEKRAWQKEKEAMEMEMESKKKQMAKTQAEIDRGLKDVKEQRDQLYRKLDLLKGQGIEIMGPNMSVLKTEPPPNQSSHHQADVLFYSEVSSAENTFPRMNSASSASFRSTGNSMVHLNAAVSNPSLVANSVGSGGSLTKKDLIGGHSNLAHEGKGDKSEIKQQIPVKLSSKLSVQGGSSKEKGTKKMSSVANLGKQNSLASSSLLSTSMGNIAKPIVEGGVQQILPFKLSEKNLGSSSSNSSERRTSPKPGYQKLTSVPSPPSSQDPGGGGPPIEISHQRTGSSPAQMNPPPRTTSSNSGSGTTSNNTLPKVSSGQKIDYNEDQVMYF
eukprot:TCALIF_02756-PA protein Name:"Similar to AKAP13 A-kinase anchor protein 13 (Homo sapiens)" AED:0.12 eAED:0.12 QI:0/0.64/0.6/0.73/1/1/15/1980/1495